MASLTTATFDVTPKSNRRQPTAVGRTPARASPRCSSTVVRPLAFVVILYIGPGEIARRWSRSPSPSAISWRLFVGANKLFDLTYDRWTLFLAIAGFVRRVRRVPRRSTATGCSANSSPRPWAWALIGGAPPVLVMFLRRARPVRQRARLPLGVAGFAGLGVLVAVGVRRVVATRPRLGQAARVHRHRRR